MPVTWSVRAVVLAAIAASMTVFPTAAQRSTTRGLTLGVHLQGASLSVEDDDPAGGGGLGARVGYGFNRRFTGYLEVDGIVFDEVEDPELTGQWSMAHVDLGVRFNFANSLRRWVPFLEAAFGARGVHLEDARVNGNDAGDLDFSGGAFSFGGGVSFFATEKFAIETLMKFSGGTFEQVDAGNLSVNDLDIDASSFRFKFGIAWWP
jgi:hypothetical protein